MQTEHLTGSQILARQRAFDAEMRRRIDAALRPFAEEMARRKMPAFIKALLALFRDSLE